MKKWYTLLISFFLVIMTSKVVYANDNMDKQQIDNSNQIQRLYQYMDNMKTNEEIMNGMSPSEYVKSYLKDGKDPLSFDRIVGACTSVFIKEVQSTLKLMISVIVLAILSTLLKNIQGAFSSENISNIAFYACYAVMILILSKSFLISVNLAKDTIKELTDFVAVLLPALVLLLSTAGGITQAATMDPIVLGAVSLTPRLYVDIIIPLILMIFVLGFVNNISNEHKIDGLVKVGKQAVLWMQGIVLTIFIGLLTVRGIASNTIDAVTLKTAKFAVDNFIPIVGKALSDAIATVAGYSLLLKNAVSSIGLIIMIFVMLFPIIKMVVMVFIYKISAAVIEPVADKRIVSCITTAADSLVLITSSLISITVMFFVMTAIMSSAGKFIVGG
ncbi:stage III sporulation protein AE [Clostridium folliculivorans]|uniref:Stage III sporulation protein AE n=1 Tax=Clostridium folliculivorans TaxID=2886038 RepID=A0A9W5XZR8_9CLOT|nr:stage III sporulation protein AE [Clostridium folliculivorans]GKU23992.1 stage III sporulation protein AE [Clostridium folliculivorans]GKU30107.1 stage III sporulation protein AE [Clostridium folliculivorans]